MKLRRALGWLSFGVAGVSGLAFGLQEFYYRRILAADLDSVSRRLHEHLDRYLADKRRVDQLALFPPSNRKHDAGTFLNDKVEWSAAEKRYEQPVSAPVRLPAGLAEKLERWRGTHLDHLAEVDFKAIDMRWLAELSRFDYWDVHHRSPMEKAYEAELLTGNVEPFGFAADAPLPRLIELGHWAALRWMRAVKDGSYVAASRELRHVAHLLMSTETFVGSLMAVAVLGYEPYIHGAAVKRGLRLPPNWKPLSMDEKDSLKRFVFGSVAYFSPLLDADALTKALLEPPLSSATCGSIMEGIQVNSVIRPALASGLPFERSFRDPYAKLDEIVAEYSKRCRLPYGKIVWDNPRATVLLDAVNRTPSFHHDGTTKSWMMWLPFTRTILPGELLLVSQTDYLSRYETPTKKP